MQNIFSASPASVSFETFRVVAHMKTPVILNGDLTLESLLAACVFEETGAIQGDALQAVPIDFLDTPQGRVWSASAVKFDGRLKQSEHTFVRGRHFSEVGPDFYNPNPRARKDGWAIEQGNGPYKRLMNPYSVYEVTRLVWYARGDRKRCQELLQTQGWLGKRRGAGFGEVASFELRAWAGNPVVDEQGLVRRPVALRKLPYVEGALPRERQRVISTVDSHPAWLHAPELCAVSPSRTDMRPEAIAEESDGEMFFED